MHSPIQIDKVPLGFGDALEPIQQRLSSRILRVVELDLVPVAAVFETEGLNTHIRDLQTGFDGALEPVELISQAEYLLSFGCGELNLYRIVVVLGFLVGQLPVSLQRD